MQEYKKTVFLPIETYVREYHYKLALAVKLSSKGYRVVLGQSEYLDRIKACFPSGVYVGKNIFKTLFPTSDACYLSYKNKGWSIIHLDEEGGIFAGLEKEWVQELDGRLDPTVLQDDDTICCWGDFQANHYLSKQGINTRVIATGQPKFDYNDIVYSTILSDNIKFYDEFLLFNMNYGISNNKLGQTFFLTTNDRYRHSDVDDYRYKREVWQDQYQNLGNILKVIDNIISDPDYDNFKIVIRPHPAEDTRIYQDYFNGNDRVVISRENTAVEWSMKAMCTVHDGCTTGLEAYLSGSKSINYRESEPNLGVENIIPNSVGIKARNIEQLKLSISESKYDRIDNFSLCQSMIKNLEHNTKSFDLVIEEIENSLNSKGEGSVSKIIIFNDLYSIIRKKLSIMVRFLFPSRSNKYKRDQQKFNSIDFDDINRQMLKMKVIDDKLSLKVKYNKMYVIVEKVGN